MTGERVCVCVPWHVRGHRMLCVCISKYLRRRLATVGMASDSRLNLLQTVALIIVHKIYALIEEPSSS